MRTYEFNVISIDGKPVFSCNEAGIGSLLPEVFLYDELEGGSLEIQHADRRLKGDIAMTGTMGAINTIQGLGNIFNRTHISLLKPEYFHAGDRIVIQSPAPCPDLEREIAQNAVPLRQP